MRIGSCGRGGYGLGLPGLDSERTLEALPPPLNPPLTLSSWGDDGLEPADLCELHPEGRGVEISWLLLASQ